MEPNKPAEAQNLEQQSETTANQNQVTDKPKNDKKKVFIILGIFLLMLLVISSVTGAYWYGKNSTPSTLEVAITTNDDEVEMQENNTYSPTIIPQSNWKIYTSKQLPNNSLKPFTINYPDTWTLTSEGYPEYDRTKITKDLYAIEIYQAAYGGAGCIFEGDVPEGPFGDYRNLEYSDINSEFGLLRRFIDPAAQKNDGQIRFGFCISTDNKFFGAPTIAGDITYIVPLEYEKDKLTEMDNIIKTLVTVD